MAVPLDNVIRFPDGVRGSVADFDRVRLLAESRDLTAHKLREAFRALLPKLEEALLARGDVADGRESRQMFYGAKDILHDNSARLEGLLAAKWLSLFEQRQHGSEKSKAKGASSELDELQLVDFGTMDHELAVKAVASALKDACEEGLFAVGTRLGSLVGSGEDLFPIEDLLAQALDGAFGDAGIEGGARIELLHVIQESVGVAFAPAIHAVNSFLVGRGILPKLRRDYARAAGSKKDSAKSASSVEAEDIFAMLQKIVASQPGTAAAAGPGGFGGGPAGATGAGTGVPGQYSVPANMAVAMDQIMSSLTSLQGMIPTVTANAPLANVLRDFRGSETGQNLGYLDAVTVDIVATLFDFIFDDSSVSDPIKALVARLQIPLLKVAMLDKTFFSSKSHPARRLLDCISKAAIRFGPGVGHEDPLYAKVASIVDRLQAEFAQDASMFDQLCVELDTFLESQEADADARAAKAAPLVAEQERREMAAIATDQALSGWLTMSLPEAVSDLLSHEWRALLIRHYINGDDAAWGNAMTAVSDLVASVQIQPDVKSRKQLATRLPTLVRRIHDGLDSLKVADDRRLMLIDALFGLHAAVLRGAAPVVAANWPTTPASEPAPAEIASERVEEGDTELERISLAEGSALPETESSDDAQAQVADLQRGDWVEFVSADAGPMRYRLSWISPQRGILLFTNPQSPKAISVAPDALALQIERGEAHVVPVEPMFDRAVTRALETLKAA